MTDQHRLRGVFAQQAGDVDIAERAFRRARTTARELGSRALELRATVSLARLLLERGAREEADALLTTACDGLDTKSDEPDLRAARDLLAADPSYFPA